MTEITFPGQPKAHVGVFCPVYSTYSESPGSGEHGDATQITVPRIKKSWCRCVLSCAQYDSTEVGQFVLTCSVALMK